MTSVIILKCVMSIFIAPNYIILKNFVAEQVSSYKSWEVIKHTRKAVKTLGYLNVVYTNILCL